MTALTAYIRDSVIITDRSFVIKEINPAAEEYLDVKDAVGKPLEKIITPLFVEGSTQLDSPIEALEGVKKKEGIAKLSTIKGERRVRYKIIVLADGENKDTTGFAMILEDHGDIEKPVKDVTDALAVALEHTAEAIVITNCDGVIEYVNPAFETITGYTQKDAIGSKPSILKSDKHPRSFYEKMWETITSGKVWHGEIINKKKTGALYIDRASIAPIFDDAGKITHFVSGKRDITERVKALEELKQSHMLLDAISHAQTLYINESSVETVFEHLLKTILELTKSEYGVIAELIEPMGDAPYLKANALSNIAWNEETRKLFKDRQQEGGLIFSNMDNLLGATIKEGKPVISNNPSVDPRSSGLPKGHPPLNSYMGLPVMRGDKLVGIVGMANREDGYDSDVFELLKPLLATCANLMEAIVARTERTLAETQLKERALQLKEANALKQKMIDIVSHDLRSPFAANIGLLELLGKSGSEPLTKRQRKIIKTMSRSLGHQLSMVENLLELSRVYKGGIKTDPEPTRATFILKESCEMLKGVAQKKGIEILTSGDESLWVNVDRERMIQVVNNLITNSIKFTKRGGFITLGVEKIEDEVALFVSDTGVGVPPDRIPRLFALSDHSFTLGTEGERGTGLGLNICQELTALNGGRLAIESIQNEGTTIRILFPPAKTSQAETARGQ